MKKVSIFLSIIIFLSLMAIGCNKEKIDKSKEENHKIENSKSKSDNEIKQIAFESLSDNEKNTIINWMDGKVEVYKSTTDHSVGSSIEPINIKDKDTYKVTFGTNNEETLGPITMYLDRNTYEVLGVDLRD